MIHSTKQLRQGSNPRVSVSLGFSVLHPSVVATTPAMHTAVGAARKLQGFVPCVCVRSKTKRLWGHRAEFSIFTLELSESRINSAVIRAVNALVFAAQWSSVGGPPAPGHVRGMPAREGGGAAAPAASPPTSDQEQATRQMLTTVWGHSEARDWQLEAIRVLCYSPNPRLLLIRRTGESKYSHAPAAACVWPAFASRLSTVCVWPACLCPHDCLLSAARGCAQATARAL